MTTIKMAVMVLYHPVVAFGYIQKKRDSFRYLPAIVLVLLAIAVRIFAIQFTHYPLSSINMRNGNLFMECAKLFVPVFSWILASYAMTTIMSGETLLRESLMAGALSMIPYIILTVPLTILSRILEITQLGFYSTAQVVTLGWMIILMIISLKEMNHFSGAKTFVILLLSLFTVAILWAAVVLFFSISSQFIAFVQEVLTEVKYKFD